MVLITTANLACGARFAAARVRARKQQRLNQTRRVPQAVLPFGVRWVYPRIQGLFKCLPHGDSTNYKALSVKLVAKYRIHSGSDSTSYISPVNIL